ncbi:MAG: hypothetical protein KBT28_07340 [Bacteroidales bacterium]|nr:hypothetical protein [Candidatus Colimorpha merdihippi]
MKKQSSRRDNGRPLFMSVAVGLAFITFVCISFMNSFDSEDLHHMQAHSFREGAMYAIESFRVWNSRIGELVAYVAIPHNGIGSLYLQIAYYVVNPLFCICAILLCMRLGTGKRSTNGQSGMMVLLFGALCFLGSKQDWFWFIGNMNWLYPCVAAMLLFVFWEGIFSGDFKVKAWKFLLSLPLAVVGGMSNENTSIISLLLFMGSGVYACMRQRRICVTWQYVVVAVLLLASALVFYTAPCRAARAATAGWELSFLNILFHSLLNPINWAYTAIFYWREAMVLGAMVYIGRRRGVKLMDKRLAFMILVILLLWGVLLAAPCWGAPRAYTPLDLMLIAIMERLLYKIVNHKEVGAREVGLILSLRAVLTLTILVPTVVLAVAQYGVRCQIAKHAEAAFARGETRLVLRKGDLDTSPVMPRFFHIPGCVVPHDLKPQIPLIGIPADKYANSPDFTHHVVFPYQGKEFASCGDDVLNRGVAKRFGLESSIYVR